VHDIVNLEGLGVPSVFVASTEFVEAADAQSAALGADPARVFVPHPIQDRTDDEVRALADAAVDELLAAITA
jgi:alkanesulfonate monooxygenase SsuD/methylene tetrahydromethanopterin reductase-like flavin-dependent oxidoreductase (luciferase family)